MSSPSRIGALIGGSWIYGVLCFPLFSAETPPAAPVPAKPAIVENAVVKIFSTARYPDPYKPWAKQAPREWTGTGVIRVRFQYMLQKVARDGKAPLTLVRAGEEIKVAMPDAHGIEKCRGIDWNLPI